MTLRKILQRISFIVGFLLLTLIALAFILPKLYQDELRQLVKDETNKRMNAKLDFDDLNLSLFASLPDFRLTLTNPSVVGIDAFQNQTLFKSADLKFDLDFAALIKDRQNIVINEIRAKKPEISLITNQDGASNWDVAKSKPSSSVSAQDPLNFELEQIVIESGYFSFLDKVNQTEIELEDLNLSSSGNFNSKGFDLNNLFEAESIYFSSAGIPYLNHVNGQAKIVLGVDLENEKYTFDDGNLTLNALPLTLDGFVDINDNNYDIDLKFVSASSEVKTIFSLLPNTYTTSFDKVQSSGKLAIEGTIIGILDTEKRKYPKFDFDLVIENGMVKYPDLPLPIQGINANIQLKSQDDKFNNIAVDAHRFSFNIDGRPVVGNAKYHYTPNNSTYAGAVKGNLSLNTLAKAYPMPQFNSLAGDISTDLTYGFTQNQIANKDFRNIEFDGTIDAKDLKVDYAGYPSILIDSIYMQVNPQSIVGRIHKSTFGSSDLKHGEVTLSDPLALFTDEKELSVVANATGTNFYADEWISADSTATEIPADTSVVNPLIPGYLKGKLDLDYELVQFGDYAIQDFQSAIVYDQDQIDINSLTGHMKGSDWNINGKVYPINDWVTGTKDLRGTLALVADHFVIDDWIPAATDDSADSSSLKPVVKVLPEDMNLEINSTINRLDYGKASWQDLKGQIVLNDQALEMRNVTSSIFGGRMNFEGIYNELPANPSFSIKYDASSLRFKKMFDSFISVQKLAPISKFIDGLFNTTLVLEGELTDGYMPVWDKLKAAGFLQTLEGVIEGFKPMEAIADKLDLKVFEKFSLKDSKNWFEVIDGKVSVQEFTRKLDDIDLRISGNHAIDNDLDYVIFAQVPRKKFNQIQAGQKVNEGLEWINKEASKLGLDVDAGDFVNIQINLTGNIINPKVDIKLVDISGKSLDDAIKDKVTEEVTELKDSVKQEIDKNVEKAKDTVTAIAEKEIEKAKEKVGEEVTKITDSAKVVITEKAKEVLDSVGQEKVNEVLDSLISKEQKEKAEEILGKEADKVKDILKDWNPFKKKPKPEATKVDTAKADSLKRSNTKEN